MPAVFNIHAVLEHDTVLNAPAVKIIGSCNRR